MLRSWKWGGTLLSIVAITLTVGCQAQAPPATTASTVKPSHDKHPAADADSKVLATLIELSPEDRRLAESQKFCAVMNQKLLGSMGVPVKLEIMGEPVFLCCSGCRTKALKNPDETLAKVAKLKAEHHTGR